ncbi:hypothetical protein KIF59_14955 [Enterobacter cloacae subsp. cloacae]|nr:hypothetical protein [Enterobacter cloacae subsp. cloacae]
MTDPALKSSLMELATIQSWDNGAVLRTGRRRPTPGPARQRTLVNPRCSIGMAGKSAGVCCTKQRSRKR